MEDLPDIYMTNKKAWATQELFAHWFHNHLVPEVEKHQMYELKHESENMKSLLLLDNAPTHTSPDLLRSKDGKIKYLFFPPNTFSLFQSMDQWAIVICKRIYRRKQLDESYVFLKMRRKGFFMMISEKTAKDKNTNETERIQHKMCNLQLGQQLE
jgi:hypothetical protein